MVLVEAAFVFGLLGVFLYVTFRAVLPRPDRRVSTATPGRWVITHYDRHQLTRVVVQKVSTSGSQVLDEHVITKLDVEDPDYDAKFLAAMATARERRALFEAEEG
jgi:hypothetical protein